MTTKRKQVEEQADALVKAGKLDEERMLWQEFGRHKRPHRVLQALTILSARIERRETMVYQQFSDSLRIGSHWERNEILKLVLDCCEYNHWAPFTVIVVRSKEQKPGPGFVESLNTATGKAGVSESPDQIMADCFNREIPSALELAIGFSNWMLAKYAKEAVTAPNRCVALSKAI